MVRERIPTMDEQNAPYKRFKPDPSSIVDQPMPEVSSCKNENDPKSPQQMINTIERVLKTCKKLATLLTLAGISRQEEQISVLIQVANKMMFSHEQLVAWCALLNRFDATKVLARADEMNKADCVKEHLLRCAGATIVMELREELIDAGYNLAMPDDFKLSKLLEVMQGTSERPREETKILKE